jgi:hypothetical protein
MLRRLFDQAIAMREVGRKNPREFFSELHVFMMALGVREDRGEC